MQMTDAQAAILVALITLVGGGIGGWLAMTRLHYRQQWWERKADAYDKVMGALGDIAFCEEEFGSEYDSTNPVRLSEQYKAELRSRLNESISAIKKLSGSGDFLITQQTADKLLKTAHVLEIDLGIGDELADIEKDRKAVAECQRFVKQEARKDLKL